MDEILYLEPDEEITSVVDKLKGLEANSVGLVAPKGSSIVQSLVSLKLLQKQAKQQGKEIAIITSDEVGQNLASRIDLPVYADVRSRKPIEPIHQKAPIETGPIEITDEPAVETAELAEAKVAEKSEPVKADKEEIPEEYKDLPKSFEVHRYDDVKDEDKPAPAEAEQEAEEPKQEARNVEEPKIQEEEPEEKAHEDEEESNAKFVNRPLREKKEDNRMELEHARPMAQERKIAPITHSRKKSPKKAILITLGVILFVGALALADLAMAKLDINLTIPAEEISKDVVITVQKDHPALDLDNGIIGGTQVDKDVLTEGNYTSSGEKETGDKAKGTLTFSYSNDTTAQIISAGTTVKSKSGVEFTLDSNITVPGATISGGNIVVGKATGAVTASSPGIAGNLPASTQYAVTGKVGVSAEGATTGGTTKKVKLVAKADIDAAKKDLQDKAVTQFKDELKTDKKVLFIDDAVTAEVSEFTTSKNVGDQADNFKANAKVKIVTLTFLADDFNQAVQKTAEKDLPAGKSLLITESDSVTPVLEENQLNVGKLKIKGELRSHIGPKIDLDQLVSSFRFKPVKKIKTELEAIQGVTVDDVKISPNYALPIGPLLKKNTHIKIEYTKK